ncbi:mandelate racemase/muconate lactonizing enzyme family protein [Halegenticoccus tardaugens]|uniref:mandelate racemase/muconate lactonizing enzyme family protein n=1 Tax=Halegenticoccus tardaugens TaxID=2071624 RepID=UPI00100BCC77|nr:enolase C-terminal domain-like protein [Halegenticoccus tardaugens]
MPPRLREFSVRLKRPLGTATGEIADRRGFLVGVEIGGQRGVGEATPLPGWTESFEACRAALDRLDHLDRLGHFDRSDSLDRFDSLGRLGRLDRLDRAPAARHGLSLAVLDAAARAEGVPLASVLSADDSDDGPVGDRTPPTSVPVNATVGDGSVAETVAAAEDALSEGYDCLKVKVGARDLGADLDRLRAVRDAVGDDAILRADANGAWDRGTAERAVDALAALDLAYVEQPLPAADLAGHAALRGRGVDVALDESIARRGLDDALRADAADVVVLKPAALGGPLETVRAARIARERGVTPVVTTTVDAAVARAAAVHVAAAIPDVPPCGLATGGLLAEDLGVDADPAPVADGEASVPVGPGNCGAAFDALVWDR